MYVTLLPVGTPLPKPPPDCWRMRISPQLGSALLNGPVTLPNGTVLALDPPGTFNGRHSVVLVDGSLAISMKLMAEFERSLQR